jgi:hypothetical protein
LGLGPLRRSPATLVIHYGWHIARLIVPEALLASGDGEVAAQLSQLKGQMSAIEQAIIDKKCAG